MRPHRLLLLPLTALVVLGATAPALGSDVSVDVTRDFSFEPGERTIAVGDKVVWTFSDGGHTTTSASGQAEKWDSGLKDAGGTFEHTFERPGRYQYICKPHRSFMRGVIQVGEDSERDTVDALETKPRGSTVKVSFRLNEAAKVTYRLKGPSRKTVSRGRLAAGKQSFRVRRLKAGAYRGTLTLVDDFDNEVVQKGSFKIR